MRFSRLTLLLPTVCVACLSACAPDDSTVVATDPLPVAEAPETVSTPAQDASGTPTEAVEARLSRDPDFAGPVRLTDVRSRSELGWTVVSGLATTPDGSPTDHCPDLDGDVRALLRQFDGQWEVVDYGACASDVWWDIWTFRYGVPTSLVQGNMQSYESPFLATVVDTDDGYLSLRTEPSASRGERIVKMPSGENVSVVQCQSEIETLGSTYGRWCEVVYHEQEGWAFSAYMY